ncbi:YceI family protein [Thiomicrorhabdus sp. zzn3]|uniref:YceI family protein n=1 Tax=Thiomicrorhabdus sp. zzn3 TaxID=3039775 RepID=UPI002436EC41|nr:YceI family protein [Thiomicrorhabdus sp. zzn3]MDG6778379.1 YceI family protein [Thiomicrorhabdus sp. zzn3]
MSTKTVILATTLTLATAFSGYAFAKPVDYVIDTKGMHASINFKIQHLGYSWLTGRFNQFSGEYTYDNEKLSNSHIEVMISTDSVNTNHAERDKHLRSADFLNVKKYPDAKFVSTAISGTDDTIQVKGNLTLNGVTKEVVIEAKKMGEGKDPWGGYRSGFSGTTSFKLADFNITYDLGPASTTVWMELNLEGIRK